MEWADLGGSEALLRGWHQGPMLAQAPAFAAVFGSSAGGGVKVCESVVLQAGIFGLTVSNFLV